MHLANSCPENENAGRDGPAFQIAEELLRGEHDQHALPFLQLVSHLVRAYGEARAELRRKW
jgi:hypothetical protein